MMPGRTAAAACLVLALAAAVTVAAAPVADDPAAAWLGHARKCLAGVRSISARFSQDLVHPLGDRGAPETGTLELRRGGRLRLDYDAPNRRQVACDGRMVRSWDPASRLFVEQPATRDLLSAFALVAGDEPGTALSARFLGGAREPEPGGGRGVIALTPAGDHPLVERVVLVLEPSCPGVARVVVVDGRGAALRLTFSAVRENPGIGHRRFVLEPPAGVKVVRP